MNAVDKNTYRAYINPANIPADDASDRPMHQRPINAMNLAWKVNIPESLEAASIRVLAENWTTFPDIYLKFQQSEDQTTFLDILSIDLPLSDLCAHIDEDAFWKRMVRHRWFFYSPMGVKGKKWIQIFLEKHLAEQLENMKPTDYEVEAAQQLTELCAKNVETLMVRYLQPATIGTVDHIPFDVFLTNLPELRKIDLTYDIKNVDTNFTLGATNLSENDIKNLAKGLECCMELKEFRVHSTKLEPPMLKMIANALDKACRNLEVIAFPHCRFGDSGLESFLLATTKDSFPKLKEVVLTNNFISAEGAFRLANAIKKRKVQTLDLRLNPIKTEGASVICSWARYQPVETLSLACCSFDDTIAVLLLPILRGHATLRSFDISSNKLNDQVGQSILTAIAGNRVLRDLDLRNSDISYSIKADIDSIVLDNRPKEMYDLKLT